MIVYPRYLDVPMLVSVLAAMEDGGLNVSGGLASLGIDLEGRVGSEAERTAANAIAQRHTVGSLFHRLRAGLAEQTRRVTTAADLATVQEGDFVELSGALSRNPGIEFLNVMERLYGVADTASGGAAARSAEFDVPDEMRHVFSVLKSEIDQSPVVDATLSTGSGVTAVLSFQRSFVSHDSLDDLRFGRVRILGKAVGTLDEGQTYNIIARSLVGHMVSLGFDEALQGMITVNEADPFPIATQITGPGLFIVPLAAFV